VVGGVLNPGPCCVGDSIKTPLPARGCVALRCGNFFFYFTYMIYPSAALAHGDNENCASAKRDRKRKSIYHLSPFTAITIITVILALTHSLTHALSLSLSLTNARTHPDPRWQFEDLERRN
jgi:hypothetical protein